MSLLQMITRMVHLCTSQKSQFKQTLNVVVYRFVEGKARQIIDYCYFVDEVFAGSRRFPIKLGSREAWNLQKNVPTRFRKGPNFKCLQTEWGKIKNANLARKSLKTCQIWYSNKTKGQWHFPNIIEIHVPSPLLNVMHQSRRQLLREERSNSCHLGPTSPNKCQ